MSNAIPSSRWPHVLFFGMQGKFSYAPLHALLEAGIQVCAVIIPSEQVFEEELPAIQKYEQTSISRTMLPVLNSSIYSSIIALAKDRNIPVWKVRHLTSSDTIHTLKVYQPDIICVACFSKRIPQDILDIPRFGCLNVHPSLLPANRGPVPLFWTFREGSAKSGVTIHLIDAGLDSGAIVAQEAMEIPDGISYSDLEEESAQLGGTLLVQSVWHLYNQEAVLQKQDESKSSYHPFPCDDDFVVPVAEWSARHVYNFICGVAAWGSPVALFMGGETIEIKRAISYSQEATDKIESKGFRVRCKRGSVLVQ